MTPNEMKALRLEAIRLSIHFNQTIVAAALNANKSATLANSYDQAEEIVEYVVSGTKPKETTA
jgi:hypothetical protein